MAEAQKFVAGVGPCLHGWVVVLLRLTADKGLAGEAWRVVASFTEVVGLPEVPLYLGVDIPIGLLDHAVPDGRNCDRDARAMLGPKRGVCLLSPPVRAVLSADSYEVADALNRASSIHDIGLSEETFKLLPQLREVHDVMMPEMQMRLREVHHELSYAAMNGGRPLENSSRSDEGIAERMEMLDGEFEHIGLCIEELAPAGVPAGTVLDTHAAAWTAWRMARRKAHFVPVEDLQLDSRGLRMGIWY